MERRVASLTDELHVTHDQLLKVRRENVAKVTSLQQQLDEKTDVVASLVRFILISVLFSTAAFSFIVPVVKINWKVSYVSLISVFRCPSIINSRIWLFWLTTAKFFYSLAPNTLLLCLCFASQLGCQEFTMIPLITSPVRSIDAGSRDDRHCERECTRRWYPRG